VLPCEIDELLPLFRREAAPQVPSGERDAERPCSTSEAADPWHRLILAQHLAVVPVRLPVAVAVPVSLTAGVVGSVVAVLLVVAVGVSVAVAVVI
jgi:hypothetical protein